MTELSRAPKKPLTVEQQRLVEAELGRVEPAARRLLSRYAGLVELDELVALGREGLVEAARSFDPKMGVPFGGFAYHRMQGAMLEGVRSLSKSARLQRVGARAAQGYLAVVRNEQDVMSDTEEQTQAHLYAFSDGLVAAMFHAVASEARRIPEEEIAERELYRKAMGALGAARTRLAPEDRALLDAMYDENRTLGEAAERIGVSYSTAYRAHKRVLTELRHELVREGVDESPT